MAVKTPSHSDALEASTRARARARRLNLFAFVFAALGFAVFSSLGQQWYTAKLPPTQVVEIENVTATASLTGWQLAHLPANADATTPSMSGPQVPVTSGLVSCAFWLFVIVIAGGIGTLLRSGLVVALGLMAGTAMCFQSFSTMRTVVENPFTTGEFIIARGPGQQLFEWTIMFAIGASVLAFIQILACNRAIRNAERATAIAEGRTPPPTMTEQFSSFVSIMLTKSMRMTGDDQKDDREDAKST